MLVDVCDVTVILSDSKNSVPDRSRTSIFVIITGSRGGNETSFIVMNEKWV
jgi:hypothetical protein